MIKNLFVYVGFFLFSVKVIAATNVNGEELVKNKNCLSCHSVDKKVIGPSYRDVAKKYEGDSDAQMKLKEKLKKGGSGVWGSVSMPPQTLSDKESKVLIKWILSQK